MLSKISYTICAIVMLYACLGFYPKWHMKGGEAPTGWDVSGYYWYLPSVFIYKDLKYQSFADSVLKKYQPTPEIHQFTRSEDGTCVMTYSSGMAFMYLPLFTIAHFIAPQLGYPADGFSLPYQFALQVGSLLVGLLGLWFFRKFLLLYYKDKVVALLLLLLVVGTNYLNYTAIDGPMTHNWLFVIYTFLLLNTHKFYKTPHYKYAVVIGILCGLAILIRPSEMVAVLIPLLWGLQGFSARSFKAHILFLKGQVPKIVVAAILIVLIGCIQLAYWKYVSGHWLVYSYKGDELSFSWFPPHTYSYLFSYKSGWLIYTPLMILAWVGFLPFLRHGKNRVAVSVFIFATLYIVSAWNVWWYGGLGGRAMMQSYALLFIPFGALVTEMFKRRWLMLLLLPMMILLSYVSLWVTIQAHKGTGLFDVLSMNKAYYWHVVGRWHIDNKDAIETLKDTDELFDGIPQKKQLAYSYNYEADSTIQMPDKAIEGERSAYVLASVENSAKAVFKLPKEHVKWLRVNIDVKCYLKEWNLDRKPQLLVRFNTKEGKEVKTKMIRPHRWFTNDNQTRNLFIDVKVPKEPFDYVEVYLWNPGSDKLLMIDNLQVWSFNE